MNYKGAKKKAKKQAKEKKIAWHGSKPWPGILCICHEIFPNIITGLHAIVKYKYCRNNKIE